MTRQSNIWEAFVGTSGGKHSKEEDGNTAQSSVPTQAAGWAHCVVCDGLFILLASLG